MMADPSETALPQSPSLQADVGWIQMPTSPDSDGMFKRLENASVHAPGPGILQPTLCVSSKMQRHISILLKHHRLLCCFCVS